MSQLNTIALIPTDLHENRLGLPSLVHEDLAGKTVLRHTVDRVARIKSIKKIVLIHAPDQDPTKLLGGGKCGKPVVAFPREAGLQDDRAAMRRAARKWALTSWRGGLGGMTCYDELLPAAPLLAAMRTHNAEAALIVGADWLLVDPVLCDAVIRRHLEQPEVMQLAFTQAPPGLAGIAVGRPLLEQMDENEATFGQLLGYNPARPQADPIGRDVCVQAPHLVRSCPHRLVYDTPASVAMIRWIASRLDGPVADADAPTVVQTLVGLDQDTADSFRSGPRQYTLELTPRRVLAGPITPHHHIAVDRPEMPLETARQVVEQMGQTRDAVLTLGGLGDALLHDHWAEVVIAAHEAGVWGIAVETDLLVDRDQVQRLLELPIDVISVRVNADTAETYRRVMGAAEEHGFECVVGHLEWLINHRNRRSASTDVEHGLTALSTQATGRLPRANDGAWGGDPVGPAVCATAAPASAIGVPWIVPRLIKTEDTLNDMESFFDRWTYYAGHAVIEAATSGCGLAQEASPVIMAPPKRFACRQLANRMTIHSDGRVALCDQDWLGRECVGDASTTTLADLWSATRQKRLAHDQRRWGESELCRGCHEWHRP